MSIKIENLKVGDTLYDVHREKAGNTTISYEGVWEVDVKDVGEDDHGPWADLSWNGNTPRRHRSVPSGYKQWPKEWVAGYNSVLGTGRGRQCYFCRNYENDGHKTDCAHPRAVAARKRAAKASKA